MNMNVSQATGNVPVTVVQLDGKLDGQTYQELITRIHDLYKSGTRNVLLDLTDLTYVSSAGLVAIHSSALVMRGEALPDPEHGWAHVKSMDRTRESGKQKNLKILNPRPEVQTVFEMVGFSLMFDIFTDRNKALQSFS